MMKPQFIFFPLAALASLFVGCESMEKGVPQEVVVMSFPTEASVYINGEAVGITPLKVELRRKLVHEVRLEKQGFNPAVRYFTPVDNEKADNFITFGLARDLGYYKDLEPRKMKAEMDSELVPASTGGDPFEKMAIQALEADRLLEAGEISAAEHKVIIEQILRYFERYS